MRKTPTALYVEDVIREQLSPAGVHALVKSTAERDGPSVKILISQDPGQAGKDQAQSIVRELAGFNISAKTESGSKEVRAEPMAAQAEAGNVKLVKGRWNADFIDELCLFPHGSNDDQVDAAAGAFQSLNRGIAPSQVLVDVLLEEAAIEAAKRGETAPTVEDLLAQEGAVDGGGYLTESALDRVRREMAEMNARAGIV